MTLFQKVLKLRCPIYFRKLGHSYGMCEKGDDGKPAWIAIDLAMHQRTDPAQTLLHEELHILFPHWTELEVRAEEHRLWLTLTPYQRYQLSRKLYTQRWRSK